MATCYANQLDATFRRDTPAVVLLWGEDAGAIRQSAQQLVSQFGVDPTDPFAADTLTLSDIAADPALLPDKASAIGFGGGKRLVRLAGVSGEERASELKSLSEAIATTLSLPLQDVLVLLPIPKLLDKSHTLVKQVEKAANGLSVRFFQDNAKDLTTWLQTQLKTAGKSIDAPTLSLLASHLGADREIAQREIEKLLLYVGNQGSITQSDIQASLAGATPADVFRLADAIGRRDAATTDRIIQQLLQQGEDLNAAFTVVLRHLDKLHTLQKSGNPAEAVRSLRPPVPPMLQKDLIEQARAYPPRRLAGLSAYALETILAARSGVLSGDHVLSRALLALAA